MLSFNRLTAQTQQQSPDSTLTYFVLRDGVCAEENFGWQWPFIVSPKNGPGNGSTQAGLQTQTHRAAW